MRSFAFVCFVVCALVFVVGTGVTASSADGPIEQWMRVIKGEEKETGSNFDYAAALTEMVLLGALAQRTGKTIEYDAQNMRVTNIPDLEDLIKEPEQTK